MSTVYSREAIARQAQLAYKNRGEEAAALNPFPPADPAHDEWQACLEHARRADELEGSEAA